MKIEKVNKAMKIEKEKKNMKNFRDLLPDFFYTGTTEIRIKKALNPLTRDFKHRQADKAFAVSDKDLRAWYRVETAAEDDRAYKEYRFRIDRHSHPYIYKYNLKAYHVFKSGIVQAGKQQMKLFKFILKNGILPQSAIEIITTLKDNDDGDLYFCVSRSPVDLMFCSTRQSYSSCMSLDSDCCYWLSTGALTADPNRAIGFFTNGKLHKAIIRGRTFRFYKYNQRAFLHLVSNGQIFIDREYPSLRHDTTEVMKSAGYDATRDQTVRFTSQFNFIPPMIRDPHGDNQMALPYFDYIGYKDFRVKGKLRVSLDTQGLSGSPLHFPINGGFDALNCIDDLYNDDDEDRFTCEECGDTHHIDDMIYGPDECYYCRDCADDAFTLCGHCNELAFDSDMFDTEEDGLICHRCYENHYMECRECQGIDHIDNMIEEDGEWYCDYCHGQVFSETCPACDKRIHEDSDYWYNDQLHCEDCFDEKIESVFDLMPFLHRKKQDKIRKMMIRHEITFREYLSYRQAFKLAA